MMWRTLVDNGWDPSKITVLYYNGTDYVSQNPRYQNPLGDITSCAASVANVQATFSTLASMMTPDDVLYIWTYDHGANDLAEPERSGLQLYKAPYTYEILWDTTFARWVNAIPCSRRVVVMAQCNSGGFIDDLQVAGVPPTAILTATDWQQFSFKADDLGADPEDVTENEVELDRPWFHSEFNYHVLNAMRYPYTITGGALIALADPDHNGCTSVNEVKVWEFNRDSRVPEYYTPQSSDPTGIGSSTYLNRFMDLAVYNKSASAAATASSNQRKIYRESTGILHETFESGGEVFYKKSTSGGSDWFVPVGLSDGSGSNKAPCLTMSPPNTVLVSWQSGNSTFALRLRRSTNDGSAWLDPQTMASGIACADPGPLVSVSGYPSGFAFISFRDGTSQRLTWLKSTDGGSSWSSPAGVPATTSICNLPSSAINTTYWSAKQANIAYATDLPENLPRIHYNYYDFQASSWGSATDLCSVLPGNYVHHANPSLAVSSSETYKTIHVAWDADDTYPGNRVLIHREGGFRYFPSVYSVLHYQSESKPSISGLIGETAWMVYQSESGTSVWKRYYDGTYWTGGYGTWVANGRNAQISVGSSTAKYIWTEGSASPYEIKVSTEGPSKAGDVLAYSRALNVIDTASGASLSLEIGTPVFVYGDGRREEVPFGENVVDSTLADIAGLLKMGQSSPFAVPPDAESLSVPIRISGIGQGSLLSGGTGNVMLNVVEATTGKILKVLTDAVVAESALRAESTLSVPVKDLDEAARNSPVQIRPEISGIRTGAGTTLSLGHMYRKAEGTGVAKGGEVVKQQGEISTRFLLHQNYPNPFNPSTRFSFDIAEGGHVSLTIHDVLGREVAKVVEGHREPGRYTVEWNAGSGATTVSSGVYLARLQVKSAIGRVLYSQTTKIIAIK